MPDARKGATPGKFRIAEGVLYKASEHARRAGHAALVIIDEINRGPAVQVFGGSIVAMESDKRLGPGGERMPSTQYFELLNPRTGDLIEYAFPESLYLLAAMNQADVSVDTLGRGLSAALGARGVGTVIGRVEETLRHRWRRCRRPTGVTVVQRACPSCGCEGVRGGKQTHCARSRRGVSG